MSTTQLRATARTHLRLFRRNRLLLAGGLVVLTVMCVALTPSLLYTTAGERFSVIDRLCEDLGNFVAGLAGVMGLLGIALPFRDRSYELVVTKPCTPEVWLGGHFLAGVQILALLTAAWMAVALGLFAVSGVPPQAGLWYAGAAQLLVALVIFSWLTLLGAFFHPALALVVALLVQPEFVRNLLLWLETGTNLSHYAASRAMLAALKPLLIGLYEALPVFSPAGEAGDRVLATLRVAPATSASSPKAPPIRSSPASSPSCSRQPACEPAGAPRRANAVEARSPPRILISAQALAAWGIGLRLIDGPSSERSRPALITCSRAPPRIGGADLGRQRPTLAAAGSPCPATRRRPIEPRSPAAGRRPPRQRLAAVRLAASGGTGDGAIIDAMRTVEALYEDGLLKPQTPLPLRPGERVGVIVVRQPDPSRWNLDRLARVGREEDVALSEQGLAHWSEALDTEDRS